MFVIDPPLRFSHGPQMLTHDDLLAELHRWIEGGRLQQKEVAAELGIAPARVSEMLNGRRRIQQREMPILARLFGMSDPADSNVRRIRRVGRVPAGSLREALAETTDTVEVSASVPRGSVAIEVDGESMNKIAPFGCDVIVDLDDKALFAEDLYVIANEAGELTFKRYSENPARLIPLSTDPSHTETLLGADPIRIIGRVVSVIIGAQHLRRMGG